MHFRRALLTAERKRIDRTTLAEIKQASKDLRPSRQTAFWPTWLMPGSGRSSAIGSTASVGRLGIVRHGEPIATDTLLTITRWLALAAFIAADQVVAPSAQPS